MQWKIDKIATTSQLLVEGVDYDSWRGSSIGKTVATGGSTRCGEDDDINHAEPSIFNATQFKYIT